jgi:hypothetical protein
MKRTLVSALFAMLLLLVVAPAFAGARTFTGTLTDGPIVSPDNNDNGNTCLKLTAAGTTYNYTLRQFRVTQSGDYDFVDTGAFDGNEATISIFLAFYTGGPNGFNPADPRTDGCFANFNNEGTVSLSAGVTYMMKISSANERPSSESIGDFVFSLTGPGDVIDIAASNPMLIDGRINGQQAAPVVLYCEGTTTHGLDTNGQVLFDVENGKSADGAWGSIAPTADGRMLLTSTMADGKAYYVVYDGCAHGHYDALSGDPRRCSTRATINLTHKF